MSGWRILTISVGIGCAALAPCVSSRASEAAPEPRPIAREIPAFEAPADPPRDAAIEEPAVVEPLGALTLQDALALALMGNPELAAFSWEARAGEARQLQAGRPPNPELDYRVYRLGIPRASRRKNETRQRVILSQVFELGRKRRRRIDLAQTERWLAGWDYEAKRVEVATVVAGHFAAVLGAQLQVDSMRRYVAFSEELGERVAALVETGSLRSLENHQAARQVGLARIDHQRAESELAAARFRLGAAWGSRSPRFAEAVGDLEPIGSIPDIETVIDLARESPAILRWDAELARGQAALDLAKAERVPDLNAGAGMRWEGDSGERDYIVDLEIDLPLFDRNRGTITAARHDVARARAERRAAEAASSEGIADVYYLAQASRARALTMRDEVIPAARATFEAVALGFDSNTQNPDDLFDARRDLARAEVDRIEALVEYHQALAALEGLVGRPLAGSE